MSPVEWDALVVGLLLVGGGLSWVAGRWRAVLILGLAVGAIGFGLRRALLIPSDLVELASLADLEVPLLQWAAWAFFAVAAGSRASAPLGGRFTPVILGALFGELGGAVLAATGIDSASTRARRVLAASAGALLGRAADPAVLVLSEPTDPRLAAGLVICAGLGLAVARPPAVAGGSLDRRLLATGAAVALASLVPALSIPVLVLGGFALMRARPDPRPALHVMGLSLLLLVAVAGGAVEQVASGLESAGVVYERHLPQLIGGTGALAGLVLGSGGGGLLGVGVLDRALALRNPDAAAIWALMAAVAGLGPLVVTGTLWRGLPRQLGWVVLSLLALHGMVVVGLLR